jgi:DNA-binding SARP family transcriptional activator
MDVRILGALEAHGDDGPIDLGLRKARRCFAVLALAPRTAVPSDRLAEALWPEGPPPRWPSVVQSHISRLRSALEPNRPARTPSTRIETRGDAYVLKIDDDELDARRFERAAAEGRAALARGDVDRADACFAASLREWRGPVLADLRDGPDLSVEVTRLEELRLVVTEEYADVRIARGEHATVVADLEVLVSEHPLRERCWELLLLALYRSGRQADALRRFQEVRAVLVGELGIEPGPGLRELEGAILRQEAGLDGAVPARAAVGRGPARVALPAWLQAPDDEFVGRAPELAAVGDAVAADGRRLVIVEGEPGIGKTRLVREACRELEATGIVVLGGRCVEDPVHVLQPFAEAIGRLAPDVDDLAQRAPADVAALAGLVPEFAAFASPMPAFDADAHRYMVFRAVTNLLDSELIGADVVLVLDDLQWAPSPTVRLLSHILRDDEHGRLVVLATVRDSEPNDELIALIGELRREHRVERVNLLGLDSVDVARLVAARGVDVGAEDVFAKTEGNPFYVEELVRHLDESGGSLTSELVPESVRDTIARRLLRLPDESRRLLGVASVSGADFELEILARAGGVSVDEADDALVPAVQARVIEEHRSAVGAYSFSHALIQTVLRDGLGVARCARVHRRIGDALLETGGNEGEAARHLLAAAADGSDPVAGVAVARRAAREAVQRYTYDDAIAVLELARATLEANPSARAQAEVGIQLANALRNAGAYERRDQMLEEAWAAGVVVDDPELLADVIIEGCSGAVYPEAHWHPRVEAVRKRTDEASRGRLVLTAIQGEIFSAYPGDAARQLCEWAVARADTFGPMEKHTVLMHSIAVIGASSPIERVIDMARAACDAARASGASAELVEGLSQLRRAYLATGDLVRSDEVARDYEALVQSVRIPRFMAGVAQRRAMRALLAGRFAEAEAYANETVSLQSTSEFFEGLAVQLFAICYEQDRLGEIRPAVEAWSSESNRPAWKIGYSVLLAGAGELDAARATISPFLDEGITNVVPPDDLYFLCLAAAATTVVATGAAEHAAALYEALAPHASRVVVTAEGALCWGSIHRFLGPLAALMGNTERAGMHFEASMAVHERLGARPFLARDRLAFAQMLRECGGDALRIETLERTGRALARELGMRHFA